MFRIMVLFAALLSMALVISGCSQNLARFSVASTGNLPITNMEKGKMVEGKECIFYFLGIPIGNQANRISGAVAKALEKAAEENQPSDALLNVDISASWWSVFLVGQNCIKAKGQPIAAASAASR